MKIRIEFKLQDCWIGAYWCRKFEGLNLYSDLHIYICLIPCFPIHIISETIQKKEIK
jgi:hypothetical protein